MATTEFNHRLFSIEGEEIRDTLSSSSILFWIEKRIANPALCCPFVGARIRMDPSSFLLSPFSPGPLILEELVFFAFSLRVGEE